MRNRFRNRKRAGAASPGPASAETGGKAGIAANATKPKAKYNAKGRFVEGQWCASEAEAVRYEQLLEMATKGLITDLRCQPPFVIVVNNAKICTYRADFGYTWHGPEVADPRGEPIVEEVKGLETPEWKLKCKLIEALYGFRIRVIRKLSGKADWEAHPELAEQLIGRKSSFAEQVRVRYADAIPS